MRRVERAGVDQDVVDRVAVKRTPDGNKVCLATIEDPPRIDEIEKQVVYLSFWGFGVMVMLWLRLLQARSSQVVRLKSDWWERLYMSVDLIGSRHQNQKLYVRTY